MLYDGEYLDVYEMNRLCYVRIYSINAETAAEEFRDQAVPLLSETDGLILDLRFCGGGNVANGARILRMIKGNSVRQMQQTASLRSGFEMRIARQIGYGIEGGQGYFDSKLVERGRAMLDRTYYFNPFSPDLYSESISNQLIKEMGEEASAKGDFPSTETALQPYDKPCVMLIGPGTASAGESMAILAQDAGIPLIGSHTAGIEGDLILERLSNGWIIGFSSGNSYGPNGELIWNHGVCPDLNHEISLEEWMAGNDTTLVAAIEDMNVN